MKQRLQGVRYSHGYISAGYIFDISDFLKSFGFGFSGIIVGLVG